MNGQILHELERELVETFGRDRLEETAFPVYTSSLPPARYLGWSRIEKVQDRLASSKGRMALDFGSGLGVMLPFLSRRYELVVACDADPEVTTFMVKRLGLRNVEVVNSTESLDGASFDVVTALDVLEHIPDLGDVYSELLRVTAVDGRWLISGPTENKMYRFMRAIARSKGEGHVHTVREVVESVPEEMALHWSCRLPFGLPLFVVTEHQRRGTDQ